MVEGEMQHLWVSNQWKVKQAGQVTQMMYHVLDWLQCKREDTTLRVQSKNPLSISNVANKEGVSATRGPCGMM